MLNCSLQPPNCLFNALIPRRNRLIPGATLLNIERDFFTLFELKQ